MLTQVKQAKKAGVATLFYDKVDIRAIKLPGTFHNEERLHWGILNVYAPNNKTGIIKLDVKSESHLENPHILSN